MLVWFRLALGALTMPDGSEKQPAVCDVDALKKCLLANQGDATKTGQQPGLGCSSRDDASRGLLLRNAELAHYYMKDCF
ncbi:hypothetical protein QJQ45_014862 [Haematococcus lacustris]|nr:hypothetical protein QJQ45_014862 [Haematococcus lacustris]